MGRPLRGEIIDIILSLRVHPAVMGALAGRLN